VVLALPLSAVHIGRDGLTRASLVYSFADISSDVSESPLNRLGLYKILPLSILYVDWKNRGAAGYPYIAIYRLQNRLPIRPLPVLIVARGDAVRRIEDLDARAAS